MANDGFNGTTIAIGTPTQTPLISVEYNCSAAKVEVTASEATSKNYVSGVPDESITFTVVGVTGCDIGAVGAVTVTWFDGSTITFTTGTVTDVSISGSQDDRITSSITVVPLTQTATTIPAGTEA